MKSQWRKYISQPGNIRVIAIEATDVGRELCVQQGLQGLAQLGFCEAIAGALIIASTHKPNESINLNAKGSAVYKQAMVDASPEGRVRGFLHEQDDKSIHTYGADGLAGPWGTGILSILYTNESEGKSPYTGVVPISSGHLDVAVNEYYRDSEQLVSIAGLNVDFDGKQVRSARGVLVQALGGASPEELDAIRALNIKHMRELAGLSASADQFEKKLSELLQNRRFENLETKELYSFCTCSKERIERALLLTGKEDVIEALADDEVMTITCDFCRTEYKLSAERVHSLFKRDPSRMQ